MFKHVLIRLNHKNTFPVASNFFKMLSTQTGSVSAKTATEESDVIIEERGINGIITLNRPKTLNALNLSMVKKIYPILKEWENVKKIVVIKGAGDKAFCAGGDVKSIVQSLANENGDELGKEFFRSEYTLNHLIGTYKRPYIAILNGITMGGGVGLSVHGKYRIATEKTLFAMPETAIGLFPDVGGSYFLPKLKGKLGLFLGLTGHRLKGADLFHVGIATHFVPSDQIDSLINQLFTSTADVEEVLNKNHIKNIKEEQKFSLEPYMEIIEECFSAPSVEDIILRLQQNGSTWAESILKMLNQMSPTSLKITKKAFDEGSSKSLAECLSMEYRLVCGCLNKNSDFAEGVRALLIDKDQKPVWNPKTISEISKYSINAKFATLPPQKELQFSKL